MVTVLATAEFISWFASLTPAEQASVAVLINVLKMMGVTLGTPHASAIKGSNIALRELRMKQGRSPLRAFYAFDPARDAVLLIGGDKSGDNKFYERMVKQSEALWAKYLAAKFPAKKK